MSETAASARAGPRAVLALQDSQDIRHAVRRLRWFASSFRSELTRLSEETGLDYGSDNAKVAQAFVGWLREFEAQRQAAASDLVGFSCFAGGLMLRELIRHEPLKASSVPADADLAHPAYFWPEGYASVVYCMGVYSAVLEQEFGRQTSPRPEFWDVEVWWSFRENVRHDPALAIGYFELFCGMEPNWAFPSIFRTRSEPPPAYFARS